MRTPSDALIRPRDVIVLATLGLLCLGVVMVHSSLMTLDAGGAVTVRGLLLSRPAMYAAAAATAMLLLLRIPVGRWMLSPRWSPTLALLAPISIIALLFVYVPGLAAPKNGSHRWITIPPFDMSMQPSEIAKWATPLVLAAYAARFSGSLDRFRTLVPPLVLVALTCGIIALEDLGTAVLISSVSCLILLAAGARWTHFAALSPIAIVGLVVALVTSPYRLTRLATFLNPYANPEREGYHVIQSLSAIASGGITGRGLGFGVRKFGYLPEDHTDFLFAVICEELGLAGALLVISAYAAIILAGISIVRASDRLLPKLAALGIVATVGTQALINLAVVTGLAPTKGIALPLVSAGGTGWLLTAAMLGVLASLDHRPASQPLNASSSHEDETDDEPIGEQPVPA